MRPITLKVGKNHLTKVDEMDSLLAAGPWHYSNGYAKKWSEGGRNGRHIIALHRLIMGAKSGEHVDHINGDKLDNRRANLRICQHSDNMKNRKHSRASKQPYKGVYCVNGKYVASITSDKVKHYLGCFATPVEAALAYNEAAIKYHGKFAKINEVMVI